MHFLNDPRPWWGTLRGRPWSVAELIANGTLSPLGAATLGWAIQHGVSVFVAAGPPGAGKSTLATALLTFLPPDAQVYVTAGPWDRLALPAPHAARAPAGAAASPDHTPTTCAPNPSAGEPSGPRSPGPPPLAPASTGPGAPPQPDPLPTPRAAAPTPPELAPVYLLVNELSYHLPVYLSGPAAQRAFLHLADGVRMLGTLHARRTSEAVRVMCAEADLDPSELATAFVIAIVAAGWRGPRIERRLVELGFVAPGGHTSLLATLRSPTDHLTLEPRGLAALATWAGLSPASVEAAITNHAAQLAAAPASPPA